MQIRRDFPVNPYLKDNFDHSDNGNEIKNIGSPDDIYDINIEIKDENKSSPDTDLTCSTNTKVACHVTRNCTAGCGTSKCGLSNCQACK